MFNLQTQRKKTSALRIIMRSLSVKIQVLNQACLSMVQKFLKNADGKQFLRLEALKRCSINTLMAE